MRFRVSGIGHILRPDSTISTNVNKADEVLAVSMDQVHQPRPDHDRLTTADEPRRTRLALSGTCGALAWFRDFRRRTRPPNSQRYTKSCDTVRHIAATVSCTKAP
jgi:hypothetical protein